MCNIQAELIFQAKVAEAWDLYIFEQFEIMRPDRVFRSEEITFVISFHQSDEQVPRALALKMYTISHLMSLLTVGQEIS
jgi:hypothetical protein